MATDPKLPGFEAVCPRTWLYTPPEVQHEELVILCTWLGAARKHIAKYTALYQRIAPHARILLIESDVPILISSYEKQRKAIEPAASVILSTLSSSGTLAAIQSITTTENQVTSTASRPKILLHTFSNGGTNTATQLLIVLRERQNGAPLPVSSLIFDSCPAKGTYWKSYTAMVLSLPRGLLARLVGGITIHCILLMLHIGWISAMGNENPASLQRRTLLDAETIRAAWRDTLLDEAGEPAGAKAVYLYSREDKQVDWNDIRDHAEMARKQGWDVEEVLFEGSGHCAHYSMHAKQYEDAIKTCWGGIPPGVTAAIANAASQGNSGGAGSTGQFARFARARL